jgi:hypothetical protein
MCSGHALQYIVCFAACADSDEDITLLNVIKLTREYMRIFLPRGGGVQDLPFICQGAGRNPVSVQNVAGVRGHRGASAVSRQVDPPFRRTCKERFGDDRLCGNTMEDLEVVPDQAFGRYVGAEHDRGHDEVVNHGQDVVALRLRVVGREDDIAAIRDHPLPSDKSGSRVVLLADARQPLDHRRDIACSVVDRDDQVPARRSVSFYVLAEPLFRDSEVVE